MSRKLFGTDGVRGVANQKLTPEDALKLGRGAGLWLKETGATPAAVLGRDTRRSGPMLGAALAAGLCSVGIDVTTLGIAPTPAVSFVARTGEFGLGGIISASHNPAPDNGIKFVGHDGRKLPDEAEARIEALMEAEPQSRPVGADLGYLSSSPAALEAYLAFLEQIVPEGLYGLKVAVDAAHGAAYELGPEILKRLGAEVFVIGATPDGMNINEEGGATKPEVIQRFTTQVGADIGVAFDGDADRAVFSDEQGKLINGDRTIGMWSAHYQNRGQLTPAVAVGTVMSNGGFEHYLREKGIRLERTPVGDKYVSQKISETGALVGGEQSGHIIFPQRGPTGDGLATMLEVLKVLKEDGRPSSAFSGDYEPWPQVLINVSVDGTSGWNEKPNVARAIEEGTVALADLGRVVVRPSGTQPMIRVMVEASEYSIRDAVAEAIVQAMEKDLGGKIYSRVDLTHALGD